MATTHSHGAQNDANGAAAPGEVPCPDPSVHEKKHGGLQDQAASAALYVTHPEKGTNPRAMNPLGPDGKLSSAGAAASLKYAKPTDLPSHPIVGIEQKGSGLTAASLAASNKNVVQAWPRPEASADAGKAAMLAKDYKMKPLWKPEASAAGGKAAMLAHNKGADLNLWYPQASKEGNSAANIALRNKGLSPQLDYGYTEDGHKRALKAATGALSNSRRKRSDSTPTPAAERYPDEGKAAFNSLNAATVAHRPSTRASKYDPVVDAPGLNDPALEASRITHVGHNMPREMFGSAPPVDIEVQEQKHQAALRGAAVSMANKLYANKEKERREQEALESTRGATGAMAGERTSGDLRQEAMRYINLQDAAQKLAAERLDKIQKDGEDARFREYWGYPSQPQGRSRLSMRGRGQPRASSAGDVDADSSDDELRSRRIRSQMSRLNNDVAQVDAKKRQTDREALMRAAERKVHAQMHTMDEKVFSDTGKIPPGMLEEWEAKAQAKAERDRAERTDQNKGKVHVGGGKFLDQSEINAIAAARIQPTLDEINEVAEKQRARDEEIRLEQEEKAVGAQTEKVKQRQLKEEQKRIRQEDKEREKAAKREQKERQKTEKEVEKARKAEEKRIQQEEKRKSKEVPKAAAAGVAGGVGAAGAATALDGKDEAEPTTAAAEQAVPAAVVDPEDEVEDEDDLDDDEEEDEDEDWNDEREVAAPIATTSTADHADDADIGEIPTPKVSGEAGTLSSDPDSIVHRVLTAPVVATTSRDTPIVTTSTEDKPRVPASNDDDPLPATTGTATADTVGPLTGEKATTDKTAEPVGAVDTEKHEPAEPIKALAAGGAVATGGALASESEREREVPKKKVSVEEPTSSSSKVERSDSKGLKGFLNKFKRSSREPGQFGKTTSTAATSEPKQSTETGTTARTSTSHTSPTATEGSEPRKSTDKKDTLAAALRHPNHASTIVESNPADFLGSSVPAGTTSKDATTTSAAAPIVAGGPVAAEATHHSHSGEKAYEDGDVSPLEDDDKERGRLPRMSATESRGTDDVEFEEARDTFDEKLAPPPSFGTEGHAAAKRSTESPVRETKFHEEV